LRPLEVYIYQSGYLLVKGAGMGRSVLESFEVLGIVLGDAFKTVKDAFVLRIKGVNGPVNMIFRRFNNRGVAIGVDNPFPTCLS
jgi:hypothetical protein